MKKLTRALFTLVISILFSSSSYAVNLGFTANINPSGGGDVKSVSAHVTDEISVPEGFTHPEGSVVFFMTIDEATFEDGGVVSSITVHFDDKYYIIPDQVLTYSRELNGYYCYIYPTVDGVLY